MPGARERGVPGGDGSLGHGQHQHGADGSQDGGGLEGGQGELCLV